MNEIWIKQCRRKLPFIENGRRYKVEADELIARSLIVDALKGDQEARKIVLRERKEAQKCKEQVDRAYLKRMVDLKYRGQRQLDQSQLDGRPAPELIPHPGDIVIDAVENRVILNGPTTAKEKVEWDQQFSMRADAQEELRKLRATRPLAANKAAHERCLQDEQDRIDYVNGTYPDEQTRRALGFDLKEWRHTQRKALKAQRACAKVRDARPSHAPVAPLDGSSPSRRHADHRKTGR